MRSPTKVERVQRVGHAGVMGCAEDAQGVHGGRARGGEKER